MRTPSPGSPPALRSTIGAAVAVVAALLLAPLAAPTRAAGSETTAGLDQGPITVASSSPQLAGAVNWAISRARQHVQTGRRGPVNGNGSNPGTGEADYIPSYWAGYAHRTAFYSRDFVHQAAGGHLLGLEEENKSMLTAFAASANEARKWYPLWALNFDGSPYNVDYRSDTNFVREVPAVFELVQEAEEQYRWTGDADYLDDPVLWQYYTKAVTDFVALHDTQLPNGIAEGTGRGIFQGAASYNERSDHAVIEAGDGLASQYRAYLAYAYLARKKGDLGTAATFEQKAAALKRYFEDEWGVVRDAWEYVRGRGPANEPYAGFGRENSVFYAVKEFLDADDKRTWDYLGYLDRMYVEDRPPNIEATTYVPDALFNYGFDEQAWTWMKDIIAKLHLPHEVPTQGTNGDYPETSFTLVSQTVEGLAGVRPNAPEHAVSVRSHLPAEIGWLDLDHIRVGEHDFGVRHDGTTKTVVNHNAGPQPLEVTVQFPGGWPKLKVDGKPVRPEYVHVNGRALTQVTLTVPVGASVTVTTSGDVNPNRHGDLILTHPQDYALLSPVDGATSVPAKDVTFAWEPAVNAREYRLRVARDDAMTDVIAEATVTKPTARIASLDAGRTFYWEVTAVNSKTGQELVVPGGEWGFRTTPTAVPEAPSPVAAYRVDNAVGVIWTAAEGALTSTVYRAPAGSDDFTAIVTGQTGRSFLDREAAGGPYRYRVTSTNEIGEGPGTVVEEQAAPADGPAEHLSDRDWVSATAGWRSVLKDRAVSGNPIRLAGTEYAKGIGTHANSEVVYDLEPTDTRFVAIVGIDDVQRSSPNASVVFQVLADGQVVYDSGLMRAQPYSPPQRVELDVLGVERLVLRVTDAGNTNNSDHADWADAKVLRLPGS
ncbi:NPCBM/NEW2 domain-containing protein [Micromonospora sp. NPDC004540]|uniref:NPCBM/NEW2 domain-containing protein n=1 Tax=Micromonospora sp. NPDC004540 TaxID=3154457 RepID=UPI0033B7D0E1